MLYIRQIFFKEKKLLYDKKAVIYKIKKKKLKVIVDEQNNLSE